MTHLGAQATAALRLAVTMAVLLSSGCATPRERPHGATAAQRLQFELPTSAADVRDAYARDVGSALVAVSAFFRAAGYAVAPESLLDSVVVVRWAPDAAERLARRFGVMPGDIPPTFAGTVAGHTLVLVDHDRYRTIWNQLYPDWQWTDDEYRRLMVHELTHRAHEAITIARLGSADRMGPAWFFEGLAVMSAGQLDSGQGALTPSEIDALVGRGHTPPVSYPLDGRLVRSLAERYSLHTLIVRASDPGFPSTLLGGCPP